MIFRPQTGMVIFCPSLFPVVQKRVLLCRPFPVCKALIPPVPEPTGVVAAGLSGLADRPAQSSGWAASAG